MEPKITSAVIIKELERELHLKQLQINRLLMITQAINENVKAEGLFEMYRSFLTWELGVKNMLLLFHSGSGWKVGSKAVIDKEIQIDQYVAELNAYHRVSKIQHPGKKIHEALTLVIPVQHKERPIAYVLIGGLEENSEGYFNKIQFIQTITNVIIVAIENKRLFKQQIEQERIRRELELGKEMQTLLIPEHMPQSAIFKIASLYEPQQGVGGDYFDCFETDEGNIAFCIADISGKGIAAALMMANFQALLRNGIRNYNDLEAFIDLINSGIYRITNGSRYITLFFAVYQKNEQTLHYINAGHVPPLMWKDGSITKLETGCTILGSFEKIPEKQSGKIHLESEAVFLMFTDGVTDVQDSAGNYFQEKQLQTFFEQHALKTPKEINSALYHTLQRYHSEEQLPDDLTILTCHINPFGIDEK